MDATQEYETILTERIGLVERITLNRPEKRNALSPLLQDELIDAVHAAERTNEVRVIVQDNGVGIGQSKLSRPNGFGVFHLRERLEYLGGRLEVTSAPGEGTRTVMVVPQRTSAEA